MPVNIHHQDFERGTYSVYGPDMHGCVKPKAEMIVNRAVILLLAMECNRINYFRMTAEWIAPEIHGAGQWRRGASFSAGSGGN